MSADRWNGRRTTQAKTQFDRFLDNPEVMRNMPRNEQVELLAQMQCTYAEISSILKMDAKELKEQYGDVIERCIEKGKAVLRRAQWKQAVRYHDRTMLVWLGKQHLSQTDYPDSHTGDVTVALNRNPEVKKPDERDPSNSLGPSEENENDAVAVPSLDADEPEEDGEVDG